MQLSVSLFFIAVVDQCCYRFLIFANILSIALLLFKIFFLNTISLYIEFIRFVTNPHSSVMVIRTPVISIAIANHSIASIFSLGFQLPLCNAFNRVIIYIANLILTSFLFLIYVAIIGLCIVGSSSFHISLPILVYLCSQRKYILLSPR